MDIKGITYIVLFMILAGFTGMNAMAQTGEDEDIILYHPPTERVEKDTTQQVPVYDESESYTNSDYRYEADSLEMRLRFIEDSIQTRIQFLKDSILAREAFVRDSILAREAFVRDSIARRKRILDSLNVFVDQLPRLLDAATKALSDEIIYKTTPIHIVGDSTLSDYENFILTFDFSSPYTPWKSSLNLSTKPPAFEYDPRTGRIRSIKSPKLDCDFIYGRNDRVLVIRTKSSFMNTRTGTLYKEPIDSVFFDQNGRVSKVKKYFQFYEATSSYRKGAKLFLHLAMVKQYQYTAKGDITRYEMTKFCDRTRAYDPEKVCTIITYDIVPQGNVYLITRNNQPRNEFSDGTFTYEFNDGNTLSSVSFENNKKTERWKNIIEVNEMGYVSRYLYDKDGKINQTLLVNYYLDDPRAKYKVETITCTFEDDGISYYQQNNMTGRSRSRDRMTLEWTDWH